MQHLEVSGAVRPLKWSLGVKWLKAIPVIEQEMRFHEHCHGKSGDTEGKAPCRIA